MRVKQRISQKGILRVSNQATNLKEELRQLKEKANEMATDRIIAIDALKKVYKEMKK